MLIHSRPDDQQAATAVCEPASHVCLLSCWLQGGGGNPFDMKNLMESVKKAQAMVQLETQRVQAELAK